MFEHNEYHIYTTSDRIEKRHVHLTEEELDEAEELHEQEYDVSNEWRSAHRLSVADNIYLTVGDGVRDAPRLESRGYEGWMPVDDGDFEEVVFFDPMIFHQCIGKGREPEWSFSDVLEWVNYEHREQFEQEFDEYVSEHHELSDVIIKW